MSKERQNRIEKLIFERQQKQAINDITERIAGINEVNFLGFIDDVDLLIDARPIWKHIIQIKSKPTTKIPSKSTQAALNVWLNGNLRMFAGGLRIYVSLGEKILLPWGEMIVPDNEEWFPKFYASFGSTDFIFLSKNQKRILAIVEDEHHTLAFAGDVNDFIHKTN